MMEQIKVEVEENVKEKILEALNYYNIKKLCEILGISRGTLKRVLDGNPKVYRWTYTKIRKIDELLAEQRRENV